MPSRSGRQVIPRGAEPRSTTGRYTATVFGRGVADDAEDAALGILNRWKAPRLRARGGRARAVLCAVEMDVRRNPSSNVAAGLGLLRLAPAGCGGFAGDLLALLLGEGAGTGLAAD